MTIAIIPARGGSKGIHKKNIINFCGKPLIAHSIKCAMDCESVTEVYVTSDCDEILNISDNHGAITIKRPEDISGDSASTESAIQHALEVIAATSHLTILLQATSPIRSPDDIDGAFIKYKKDKLDSLFSASLFDDKLIWSYKDGKLDSHNYDYNNRGRRQDRRPDILENGSFYIFNTQGFIENNNRLFGDIGYYVMEEWKSYEIDTEQDLTLTELIFKNKIMGIE
jgi:CMP-N,N'-diacetyllegionaminic acid synthase